MRWISLLLATLFSLSLAGSAIAQDSMDTGTELFMIDLESGELTSVGSIGEGETVIGFALDTMADEAGPAWAVTTEGQLLGFDVSSPDTIDSTVDIAGLEMEDWLVGIDVRPATGELIGISASSILYTIDTETGEATALGEMLEPALEADTLGFDFNPTVDRIRVDVSTTQNLRLNPETGAVGTNPDTSEPTIDGNTAFADDDVSAGMTPRVVGAAYTNSVADAESTQLFVIDAETNVLALQDPPNDGVLNTVGELSVDVTDYTGFDIHPNGDAFVTVPAGTDMEATPEA